jgi:hypothetical protein
VRRSNEHAALVAQEDGTMTAGFTGGLWYEIESELEYGCVRCQAYHGESDGPIYQEHIMSQSKHGLRRRPKGGWGAAKETAAEEMQTRGDR